MKRIFSPKNLIITALLAVVIFLLALTAALFGRLSVYAYYISPYDYLKMKTPPDMEQAPAELVYQGIAEENIYIVISLNNYGTYDCALLEKNSSGYDIIDRSGHFAHGGISPYFYSSDLYPSDSESLIEILWGTLADDNASEVLVNGKPCEIADTACGFRVFWTIGHGNEIIRRKTQYTSSGTYSQEFDPTFEII